MQKLANQSVRSGAAGLLLAAFLRRPAPSANVIKRAVAVLLWIGVMFGMSGGGQSRESLAAETTPQQTRAQSSSPATSTAQGDESEGDLLRAETLERLKAMGAVPTADAASGASMPETT
jgi:hypothetical protein